MKNVIYVLIFLLFGEHALAQDHARGRFVGDPNAPHVMEFYFSAGCSECLHMLDLLSGVMKDGTENGQLRIEFIEIPGLSRPGPLADNEREQNAMRGSNVLICLAEKSVNRGTDFDYLSLLTTFMESAKSVVKTYDDWNRADGVSWTNWANASELDIHPPLKDKSVEAIFAQTFTAFGEQEDAECESVDLGSYYDERLARLKTYEVSSAPFYTLDGVKRPSRLAMVEAVYGSLCETARACFNLGATIWNGVNNGDGVEADILLSAVLFEKSCELGYSRGCFQAARLHFMSKRRHGLGAHRSISAASFESGCRQYLSAESCEWAGHHYRMGLGVAQDQTVAYRYFERGCKLGSDSSCGLAGKYRVLGLGVDVDLAIALQLYQKGCDLEEADGCRDLGSPRLFLVEFDKFACHGTDIYPDCDWAGRYYDTSAEPLSVAYSYYERGCDLGNATSCAHAAKLRYSGGPGVDVDRAIALQFYQKACDLGDVKSCSSVGDMYTFGKIHGDNIEQNHHTALNYYQQGCDLQYAFACAGAGSAAANWLQKKALGIKNLVRACELATSLGCDNAAALYMQGWEGQPKDYEKALRYYIAACAGSSIFCDDAGIVARDLIGTANAQAFSVWLFHRGCRDSVFPVEEACFELANAYLHGVGVPQDETKGRSILDRLCRSQSYISSSTKARCKRLGIE